MAHIEIKNLSFKYKTSEKNSLSDVSFTINKGDFVVLCGKSGCGKTTLLRCLKPNIMPAGKTEGEILLESRNIESLTDREQAKKIGFVMQNPEYQIVTDKVWHELAFGLESMGEEYGIKFTPEQEKRFMLSSTFGVPIRSMQKYLDLPEDQRDKILKNEGIPCDSVDNQFKSWVRNARTANADLRIAIKADATTPYSVIKNVMNSLQDLRENRYNLITSLKAESEN